jgi:nucleoside 2-deoxyribosyltransferase
MKKLKLYLTHQFKYRHIIREIELDIEKKYNIILDNPFYDADKRQDIEKADNGIQREFTQQDCIDIVNNDLNMINESDGVLAIISDEETLGSYMEIFYCAFVLNKPVYMICPLNSIRKHIWIRCFSCEQFEDLIKFEEWLMENGYEK